MQIACDASMIELGCQESVIPESELEDIDRLVRTYRPRLLRYVSFSLGDADLAETITQDCFLKAYHRRRSFRGECAVSTWLFSIANNLIRDQLRTRKFQFWKRARATALDVTEVASMLPSHSASAESSLLVEERLRAVSGALEHLSVNQRRVFLLRFSEELEISEIARAIGMPVNTVKTHLHRALIAIRGQLGGGA